MKFTPKQPPRIFSVKGISLSHTADLSLSADELVTFHSPSGKEMDITAKDWGYYIGGSTNGRMKKAGYRTVIAKNPDGLFYILAFEEKSQQEFETYITSQDMEIIAYLDGEELHIPQNK